jgi:hypothetical protein
MDHHFQVLPVTPATSAFTCDYLTFVAAVFVLQVIGRGLATSGRSCIQDPMYCSAPSRPLRGGPLLWLLPLLFFITRSAAQVASLSSTNTGTHTATPSKTPTVSPTTSPTPTNLPPLPCVGCTSLYFSGAVVPGYISFDVPLTGEGSSFIFAQLWGAGGQGYGGYGAYVSAVLVVSPPETLQIIVGNFAGEDWNGCGGSGYDGRGGGRSAVRRFINRSWEEVMTAGGGGGGNTYYGYGGSAGVATGNAGHGGAAGGNVSSCVPFCGAASEQQYFGFGGGGGFCGGSGTSSNSHGGGGGGSSYISGNLSALKCPFLAGYFRSAPNFPPQWNGAAALPGKVGLVALTLLPTTYSPCSNIVASITASVSASASIVRSATNSASRAPSASEVPSLTARSSLRPSPSEAPSLTARSSLRPSPSATASAAGCPPGSLCALNPSTGLIDISLCPPGFYCTPSVTLTAALPCPEGSFCPAGSTAPNPCAPGAYAPIQGRAACLLCAPGSFTAVSGSAVCADFCPAGTAGGLPGSSSGSNCTACPRGSYGLAEGAAACIQCSQGYFGGLAGATTAAACQPCPAGSSSAVSGSQACPACLPGTFSDSPGSLTCTPCPLGTYSSATGAASSATCASCPAGKTTAATGALQDSQCLSLPLTCSPGWQPASAAAASLADCVRLACPAPLRPSAHAAFAADALALNKSLSCLGCGPGTAGALPACKSCSGLAFCPGLTSRALQNFSGSPAAYGVLPFSAACPALASLARLAQPYSLPSSATSNVFFGVFLPTTASQALIASVVIFALLFFAALLLAFTSAAEAATGCSAFVLRALRTVDLFPMSHKVEDSESPIKEATPLGGLFSLMGLTTLLTYAAYLVATWLQDNTLVQQSLDTMGPLVWGGLASLPWTSLPGGAVQGAIALRLTVDGNPGACAAPLALSTSGLRSGAFVLASTPDCAGSGVAQHTITCPGCQFTAKTVISLTLDYSCQSMLLEALGASPSYPGPMALSAVAANSALSAAPQPGSLLTSLTWQLSPVLSVLWDNMTSTPTSTGTRSAIGWFLADSELTLAAPLALPKLNGSLSLLPLASSITVTFALALSSTYSSTLLTQRVPITQLLANIVGLSGLLAIFGWAFGNFEAYCAKKKGGASKRPVDGSSRGEAGEAGEADEAGEAGEAESGSPPLSLQATQSNPLTLRRIQRFNVSDLLHPGQEKLLARLAALEERVSSLTRHTAQK